MYARKIFLGLAGLWALLSPLTPQDTDRSRDEKIKISKPKLEPVTKSTNGEALTSSAASEDEISLVIKGKIISVTDKEIIYKETGSNTEGRAPIHNLHFLRRASGEYRFFTPAKTDLVNPTKIETEEVKPKEIPAAAAPSELTRWEFMLSAGGTMHFARNSDSGEYMSGLSAYVAKAANQANNPKGFSGQLTTDAAKYQLQGFAEPRLAYGRFMAGLQVGYAMFPKVVGTVSSPNYSNQLSLTFDGFFIPAFAIFYYRLPIGQRFSLNLGLGGGVMYTSIKYTEDDTITSNSTRYTAWSAAAIIKPELAYKMGRVIFMLSAPFYFAESRKVESGSTALINGDSGKVISPNLTGISFSLAVGYQLH